MEIISQLLCESVFTGERGEDEARDAKAKTSCWL